MSSHLFQRFRVTQLHKISNEILEKKDDCSYKFSLQNFPQNSSTVRIISTYFPLTATTPANYLKLSENSSSQ